MHFNALCFPGHFMPWKIPKQLLRIMRLTSFLLFIGCMQVTASGISQKVTLSLKDAPVQKVFREVIRQTGVSIFYNDEYFKNFKLVTINVTDAPLTEVLDKCLANLPLVYTHDGNSIVISRKPSIVTGGLPSVLNPPPITGIVRGPDGQPWLG